MQSYINILMESMKTLVRFKLIQYMTDSLTVIGKFYLISFLGFTLIHVFWDNEQEGEYLRNIFNNNNYNDWSRMTSLSYAVVGWTKN